MDFTYLSGISLSSILLPVDWMSSFENQASETCQRLCIQYAYFQAEF